MKIATALSAAAFGSAGTFTVWDDFGNEENVQLPETVNTLNLGPDFPSWRRGNFTRTYILGGHTDNLVFTEHEWLLRIGINAPSGPIVAAPATGNEVGIAASGAAGLTGECSVALRFLDSLHFRRSPLGAASPAITLANQGLTFTNLPLELVPNDPCVDSIEVWVSVDGGLFRHWATRDIGSATFTVNETATGEAYTDELAQYPKLKFGDMMNDRMFSAGDPRHPERVYVSQLGNPEEYGGLYIPTRNGEQVIALKNIGGSTIYVQCPNSCYYIQGFGASDLVMRVLKPKIGGFGQRSIAQVDDIALIPTQRGWYRCDGTSMVPIGVGEWDETWRRCVSNPTNRPTYEAGFSVTDYVSGVVKFYGSVQPEILGLPLEDEDGVQIFPYTWVVNIGGLVPEIGGNGLADLSFDTTVSAGGITCAAMLYEPGASVGALYSGDVDGNVYIENQARLTDKTGATAAATPCVIHTQHHIAGPVGEDQDAFTFTDLVAWYQCEYLASTLGVYSGNEFAWQGCQAAVQNLRGIGMTPSESFDIPAGYAEPPNTVSAAYVPRDRVSKQSLAKSTGAAISIRVTVVLDSDDPQPVTDNANPVEQRSLFVFSGWGFVAKAGTDRRPFGQYISGD